MDINTILLYCCFMLLPNIILSKPRIWGQYIVKVRAKIQHPSTFSLAFASNYNLHTLTHRQRYCSLSSPLAFANQNVRRISNRVVAPRRGFHNTVSLNLNRVLFDVSEIDEQDDVSKDGDSLVTVTFPKDDYRTIHISKVLGLHNGDTIRAGCVRSPIEDNRLTGLITDDATIQWLPEGKIKKAQPTKNGEPPGSLQITIPSPPLTTLWNTTTSATDDIDESDVPKVSLLLALPRPLQLGRILPMIAQLGVDQLILTNAKKVPKDYFGSHIFRKPNVLRSMLIEGLAQSGDVRLPHVTVTKRLKIFMEDELDDMFPPEEYIRVIAHPKRKDESREEMRMSDITLSGAQRILVAVGPEGGWEEPYELDMFKEKGFQQITLGDRVLRSDVAVVSLLALAHEVVSTKK